MHAETISHLRLFVKPLMAARCTYPAGMPKSASTTLKENLLALKACGVGPSSQVAYAKKAGVGEGTVSRARRGDGNTTIANLDAMARAVRLAAWQLLLPDLDPTSPPRVVSGSDQVEVAPPAPTIEVLDVKLSLSALEVARAWEYLPPDRKLAFKQSIIAESLRHRDYVPDERLGHLAAPSTKTPAKRGRKKPASNSGTN